MEYLNSSIEAPGVLLLTLNRPSAMNAVNVPLAMALLERLAAAETDEDVRCIILTGSGERAFSAGYDIKEMMAFNALQMMDAFAKRDPLMWRIASHRKPIIAALNGVTFGAGALMAAAADIRIGCSRTRFRVTATEHGAANATWTLPVVIGIPRAKEILMTGREVSAREALEIGLITQICEDTELLTSAVRLATDIARNPPKGPQLVKSLINENIGRDLQAQFRAEMTTMLIETPPESGQDAFPDFGKVS